MLKIPEGSNKKSRCDFTKKDDVIGIHHERERGIVRQTAWT